MRHEEVRKSVAKQMDFKPAVNEWGTFTDSESSESTKKKTT